MKAKTQLMKKKGIKILKWVGIIAVILLVIYLVIFKTTLFMADIRPDTLMNDNNLENDGRTYLVEAQLAHGISKWKNCDSIVYKSDVEFIDFKASFLIAPVDDELIHFRYVSNPNNEDQNLYSAINSTTNFFISKDEGGIFVKKENEKSYGGFSQTFFYEAVQHLIEFPYLMNSANILEHVGTESWQNNEYDLIFATWGDLEPNLAMDQYIIWINKTTGLIDRFDATGREIAPWAVAKVLFFYESVDGLTYPKTINVTFKDSGDPIMNFSINDILFDGVMIH